MTINDIFWGFIVVLFFCCSIAAFRVLENEAQDDRAACREAGGRVERIHGGRGGWLCLGEHQGMEL